MCLTLQELVPSAAGASAVIAAAALILTAFFSRRTELRAVRPVLVVVYQAPAWFLKNVGNGPALDIIVAVGRESKGDWFKPVRIPPLSKDAEYRLDWMLGQNVYAIAATYQDFEGRRYTSKCTNDLTVTSRRNFLPEWTEDQIERYWNVTTLDYRD